MASLANNKQRYLNQNVLEIENIKDSLNQSNDQINQLIIDKKMLEQQLLIKDEIIQELRLKDDMLSQTTKQKLDES